MQKKSLIALALASFLVSLNSQAQFADSVVSYNAGDGVAPGYTDASVALGTPTVFIGYQNTDPFNPPYLPSDIVGLGTNGSLTLLFNTPILNDAAHTYGLDLIIFGHAGFVYGNYPATDGTFFTGGTANVRVSVSQDGINFFNLLSPFGSQVDGLFPTDAGGNPLIPVNPSLTGPDFAGLDVAGIQALYAGSGGGTGFDLGWAVDNSNQPVALSSVSYVRLDNLGDVGYIDAVSAVPEPSTSLLALLSSVGVLAWKRRTHV